MKTYCVEYEKGKTASAAFHEGLVYVFLNGPKDKDQVGVEGQTHVQVILSTDGASALQSVLTAVLGKTVARA